MTDQQKLFMFRIGFSKIKDKANGVVYKATGKLLIKTIRAKGATIGMLVLAPIALNLTVPMEPVRRILNTFLYFCITVPIFYLLGKRRIKEEDLEDVIED